MIKTVNMTALAFGIGAAVLGLNSGCTSDKPAPPPTTKIVFTNTAARPDPSAASASAQPAKPSPAAPATASSPQKASPPPAEKVVPPAIPELPPSVREVVELAQSDVGEKVLIDYVKNAQAPFNLTAEQIVYLKDLGFPESVISAMLEKDRELAPAEAVASTQAPAAQEQPQTQAQAEQADAAPSAAASQAQNPPPPVYASPVAAPSAETAPPAGQGAVAASSAQGATTVVNNYFYTPLAPYGSWVYVDDYGWCWRPTCAVVDPTWRPYCHGGRWVYTDAGWYWQSFYSWGWAPFHYGRWFLSPRFGWCWVPGPVWAPAWVTWRYTETYCGWAPLPPAAGWSVGVGLTYHGSGVSVSFGFGLSSGWYTFVGYDHFCDRHLHRHRLRDRDVTIVYKDSTVINNIVNGDNNTIINRGIPPKKVPAVARGEMPRVRLRDWKSSPWGPPQPDRLDVKRRELTVYRPKLPANLAAVRSGPARTPPPYQPAIRQVAWEKSPSRSLAPLTPRSTAPGASRRPSLGKSPRSAAPRRLAGESARPQPARSLNLPSSRTPGRALPSRPGANSSRVSPSRSISPPRTATPANSVRRAPALPRSAPSSRQVGSGASSPARSAPRSYTIPQNPNRVAPRSASPTASRAASPSRRAPGLILRTPPSNSGRTASPSRSLAPQRAPNPPTSASRPAVPSFSRTIPSSRKPSAPPRTLIPAPRYAPTPQSRSFFRSGPGSSVAPAQRSITPSRQLPSVSSPSSASRIPTPSRRALPSPPRSSVRPAPRSIPSRPTLPAAPSRSVSRPTPSRIFTPSRRSAPIQRAPAPSKTPSQPVPSKSPKS